MPNWCYNSLRVEAEAKWNKDPKETEKEQVEVEKELVKFKKENILPNKEKTGKFLSFEGSVPMPKSLKITSGSATAGSLSSKINLSKPSITEIPEHSSSTFFPSLGWSYS